MCFFSFLSQFLISWLLQESLWLNPQGQKACNNNFHSYWSFCCNHSPICHLLFSTSCRLRTISQCFNQATLNYSNSYNRMAYGPQDTFYLIVLPSLLQSNPKIFVTTVQPQEGRALILERRVSGKNNNLRVPVK